MDYLHKNPLWGLFKMQIPGPDTQNSPRHTESEPKGKALTYLFFFFVPHGITCGILVPQAEIEPARPALEAQSLNDWTAKEVPWETYFY